MEPGSRVDLGAIDPDGTPGLPGKAGKRPKAWARQELEKVGIELASHQERLYANAKAAAGRRRVLLVLQAMDCGGKDGTTRRVAGTMNPQGLHIVAFGTPTPEELAHDFLWRIRAAMPTAGYVGVFNRSHYEDVLIARVHEIVTPDVWRARYAQINQFERDLTRNGTTIVKVMLHISFEEQRKRIEQRLDDPTKHWKYNPADVDERGYWAEYQNAYQDALSECSTGYAPWHIIPANKKWYRDWAVASLLRGAFRDLRLTYPEGAFDLAAERRRLAAATVPVKQRVTRR
ncbi:polyphosphate kinase 2 family protein [Rugosimonospora acidiphila]|uniref:Polyphosphate kinase 2 family protein n=1 Tax=Rugosimonospora acidiphila TaxID=556531 RepID=A0ABP9RHV1_9ACTN